MELSPMMETVRLVAAQEASNVGHPMVARPARYHTWAFLAVHPHHPTVLVVLTRHGGTEVPKRWKDV